MLDAAVKETFIQKRAPHLALVVITGLMALYFFHFNGSFSSDPGTWGQFGDYLGGLINPIIGLITVWLLTVSIRQNLIMLKQAQEELRLAKEALQDAKAMQTLTEQTMAKQIAIADQARDINNAIGLFNRQDQTYIHLQNRLNADFQVLPVNAQYINETRRQIESCELVIHHLGHILTQETNRLMEKYPLT